LGDLGCVREPRDPRLDDVDAGGDDPGGDLGGELTGDLVGVVARRKDVTAGVVGMTVGHVPESRFALGVDL